MMKTLVIFYLRYENVSFQLEIGDVFPSGDRLKRFPLEGIYRLGSDCAESYGREGQHGSFPYP
jgi:hypothetical protein